MLMRTVVADIVAVEVAAMAGLRTVRVQCEDVCNHLIDDGNVAEQ
jgi:hypothetical protein